jgi:hypothetical protein
MRYVPTASSFVTLLLLLHNIETIRLAPSKTRNAFRPVENNLVLTTPEFVAKAMSITLDKWNSQSKAVLRNVTDSHFRLIKSVP